MSVYIHHVPGRLRVRVASLKCQPSRILAAARQLRELPGVADISINASAGSVTVRYDAGQHSQGELLAVLEQVGCIGARRVANTDHAPLVGLFGKALVGALANTVAQQSVRTLVGVLR